MAFTVVRVSAALLTAILLSPAVPDAAEGGLSKAEAQDFQMFRNTVAVRLNARICERGMPEYGETFGDLYAKWSEKHRAEIDRGESLFKAGLNVRDPKRYPYIDKVTLTRLETGLAELAQPPHATGPTPTASQTALSCEKLLTFLKQN